MRSYINVLNEGIFDNISQKIKDHVITKKSLHEFIDNEASSLTNQWIKSKSSNSHDFIEILKNNNIDLENDNVSAFLSKNKLLGFGDMTIKNIDLIHELFKGLIIAILGHRIDQHKKEFGNIAPKRNYLFKGIQND
jgi:hypothetical protein